MGFFQISEKHLNWSLSQTTWQIVINLHFSLTVVLSAMLLTEAQKIFFFNYYLFCLAFEMSRVQGRGFQCHIYAVCVGCIFAQGSRYLAKGTVLLVHLSPSLLFLCGASANENNFTEICQQLKSSFRS